MVDCSVCGKPIIDEPYVVDDRKVRHLHHDGQDQIQTSEYEAIISKLKDQLSLSVREIKEKNKVLKDTHDELTKTLEENSKLITSAKNYQEKNHLFKDDYKRVGKDVVTLGNENKRLVEELSIYKTDYEKLNEKNKSLQHGLDSMPPAEATFKLEEENKELQNKLTTFGALEKQLKELGLGNDSKK